MEYLWKYKYICGNINIFMEYLWKYKYIYGIFVEYLWKYICGNIFMEI